LDRTNFSHLLLPAIPQLLTTLLHYLEKTQTLFTVASHNTTIITTSTPVTVTTLLQMKKKRGRTLHRIQKIQENSCFGKFFLEHISYVLKSSFRKTLIF